ncbi:(p)ppGpp synthetase [Peptoniphilus sp. AGMB00490]|uniref:(P)ppGpp synthetase n=2 Tax=Peptoniphilus TaxID=162289 RepID=A0ACD6AZ09_9FIRM|nr:MULTISPECIES: (p)ppGpp synthetase [Peptoniphilus]NMW84653.1 (p)ppGpp synthetase [Peptoniphilus faecalis]OLR64502.1 (p)ppGpp synthetase [Peptoniphilus porci]
MKLELFNYIDDVLDLFDYHKIELAGVNKELKKYFSYIFSDDDRLTNITTRIKTQESLREKLIRRNFFMRFPDPVRGFKQIQDLVGIRVECRFIKDEEALYKKIIEDFTIKSDRGYYKSSINKKIRLKLDDPQPQALANGFTMYKLDGEYDTGSFIYCFELQIKSFVNVFWGEIDHKLLYKNYNYIITEGFFREIMNSINDNLKMIDKQLMILYDHVKKQDASETISAELQLKKLLSKILHDVFTRKIHEELGLFINIKIITDVVVDFLFMKSSKNKDLSYGENFIDLINKINSVSGNEMNVEEYIVFEKNPKYYDSFSKEITEILGEVINNDLDWNILFKIIRLISQESYGEVFTEFIIFVRYEYMICLSNLFENKDLLKEEQDQVESVFLSSVIDKFREKTTIEFLLDTSLNKFNSVLCEINKSDATSSEKMIKIFKDNYTF